MFGLTLRNFVSAATGKGVLPALTKDLVPKGYNISFYSFTSLYVFSFTFTIYIPALKFSVST